MLTLAHVTRRYGSLTAVDDVSLRLPAGARHAVIGPNGAGKTTLLNLVAGTERPDAGRILLAGPEPRSAAGRPSGASRESSASRESGAESAPAAGGAGASGGLAVPADTDLTRATAARRSRLGVARSFQQPSVIAELSAADNVVLAGWRHHRSARGGLLRPRRHRHLRDLALHHLDAVGLAGVADEPAGALSYGQRRMLDLAAALAGRPRLLLLDEPTAGLTDRDLGRLVDLLRGVPAQVALLLVEHHIEVMAELADTVTVLAAGRVLVHGGVREALDHPQVREVYLDAGPAAAGAPAAGGSAPGTGARE